MSRKGARTHVELAAVFWIVFTIITILLSPLVLNQVEESPWPLEDSITVEHTEGTAVKSSSDRVEVSIEENPETNVTSILTSIEFLFKVSSLSARFSFGMNSTLVTPGDNYMLNDYREAVLFSTDDSKSWDLHTEPPGRFGAVTIEFKGECLLNDSREEEFMFSLECNSTLSFDNSFNQTSDFAIHTEFAMNLEEVSDFLEVVPDLYALLANSSQAIVAVGIGGVLGVISVFVLMNDHGESKNGVKSKSDE